MPSVYLQVLRDQVTRYAGALRDVVLLAPVYGLLMFNLMKDPRLTQEQRLWVDAAIAYLVSPDDVIPEDEGEFGAYGFVDDIFCCAYVATRIAEDLGWDVVEEGWTGDTPVRNVSQILIAREREIIGDVGDEVLRFAGLYEAASPEIDQTGLST